MFFLRRISYTRHIVIGDRLSMLFICDSVH